MRKLIAGLVVALAASGTAQAADKNGDYQILGAGTVSCETFLGASPSDRTCAETWWAGYVTALNRGTNNIWSVTGEKAADRVNQALQAECTANKKELFASAVNNVIQKQLDKNKIVVSP